MHDHLLDPTPAPPPDPYGCAVIVLGAVVAAALGIALIACEGDEDGEDGPRCPAGTGPECVTPQPGDCIGLIPPLPPGRICAGGQIAQCIVAAHDGTCADGADCPPGYACVIASGERRGVCETSDRDAAL